MMRATVIVGTVLVIFLALLLILSYFFSKGECSEGTFACKSEVCVPQRSVCDGHIDCPDGEDENALTCGDYHGSQYIMNLTSNTNFDAIDHNCDHTGLVDGCFCRRKHWVYCKNLNLTQVPRQIQGTVERLILANNSIKTVELEDLVQYRGSLKLLHLEGNGIALLPYDLFTAQIQLEKLLLMNNEIEKIGEYVFKGLSNLSILYLQHNRISYLHPQAFHTLTSLRYLDLSDNLLITLPSFPQVPSLFELFLDRNRLRALTGSEFILTRSLRCIGLSGNKLKSVASETFFAVENLRELDLSSNRLSELPVDFLTHNRHLHKLNLSHNSQINNFDKAWFSNASQLQSLSLDGIAIENMNKELFSGLDSLEFVYFKKYFFCTFVPQVKYCSPKTDGMSTMDSMIGRSSLRNLLWMVAVPTLAANAFVIMGRHSTRDENRSHNVIVTNLAVADFFMGIYLIIIGIKDWEFRGVYSRNSNVWLRSWLCSIAGAIAMLSSEVSMLFITFMSIERFLIIAVPFTRFQSITRKTSRLCMSFIWITGAAIACFPWIFYQRYSTGFYGSNAMCFPLHLDDPYFTGWIYSAFIFLFLNFVGLFIVTAMYVGMFISIWRTRNSISRSECSADYDIALRLLFIVLTNALCWLPIMVLKCLAFFRIYISAAAYGWVAVVVVPVNSAFNPLIYTITTPKYQEQIREFFRIWRVKKFPSCQQIVNQRLANSLSRQRSEPSTSVEEVTLNSLSMLEHPPPSNNRIFNVSYF